MARRPPYKALTLDEKRRLCRQADARPAWTAAYLAQWATGEFERERPLARSTVAGILKRKREYLDAPEAHGARKRLCSAAISASDERLVKTTNSFKSWHPNATLTRAAVLALAEHDGVSVVRHFTTAANRVDAPTTPTTHHPLSMGWLYKFQKRNNLWFAVRHGEAGSVDVAVAEEGRKSLKVLASHYLPRDIYNMDETAFFYRQEPKGTLTFDTKAEVNGKKQNKIRITLCVGTNSDGSHRLPLHFIGKSKVPRPLKGKNLFEEISATYASSPKAWQNTATYCEWLKKLNAQMRDGDRHILLLVDNASSHNNDSIDLSNVVVEKLPPNTTAVLQPMDQGVIKSLKDRYQSTKLHAELQMFLAGEDYTPPDIYTAMKWCADSWNGVSAQTIRNCWLRTGIVSKMDVSFILT